MPAGSPARGPRTPAGRLQRGFTLLELTIVIVIIGLLIGMTMPFLNDMANRTRETATISNLDLIQDALEVFVQRNGRLPCPAAPNGTPLGTERATCTTAGNAEGIVPFLTLGLSEDLARDGYRNLISYTVAFDYATTTDVGGFCGVTGTGQAATLSVTDETNAALGTGLIPYVLVGHGENGAGAHIAGSANRLSTSEAGTFEAENYDADAVFISTDDTASGSPTGTFDDSLRWTSRDELGAALRDEGCDGDPGTLSDIELIEDALASFLRLNGRLPCPGAPNADPLGFERVTCSTNATLEGIVPFRTLSLPEAVVQDGYGRHLTYRVAQAYPAITASTSLVDYCAVDSAAATASLTVVDGSSAAVTSLPIAVVVLSHGQNGFGFYEVPLATRYESTDGDNLEDENADGDATFVESLPVADGYDDVIGWWTTDRLAELANPPRGCNLGLDEITEEHLDDIEAALVTYLARNGRVPCPAQPEATPLGEAPASCSGSGDDGIVPYRTLGLQKGAAYDGYGRLITYHVDLNFTDTGDIVSFCSEPAGAPDLDVEDENNDEVVDDYNDTPIVYVLVSHGRNGFGHYEEGSLNQVSATAGTPFEDENADDDDTYRDATNPTGANASYDDVVRWRTRENMAASAGSPCS